MKRRAPRRTRSSWLFAVLAALVAGCGGRIVVPLRSAVPVKAAHASQQGVLEVVTQSSEASDPLPVSGAGVSYGDLESSLRHAVMAAATPWAGEAWRISLDIIAAEAEHGERRLQVSMGVRATLRAKHGNVYLGQTEVACRDSATVPADKGQEVFRSCLMQLAGALAGWLGSVETDLPPGSDPDDPKVLSGAIGASGSTPVDDDGESSESSEEAAEAEGSD
ncbi:MAG TPA: hypothetical protein VK540_17330 [Polyangiaceae bacterium]|jgi:hypothetical protein|nr:hypothetical protein [Polyangiaceae bacterium]